MDSGSVLAIHLRPGESRPVVAVDAATAIPGRGLRGDYNVAADPAAGPVAPDTELTLIESKALAALEKECGIVLPAAESRRNLLTAGIALNPLVGRDFKIGAVRCRGVELCDPCRHLESMTQPGVLKGLAHRGGLRAQVLVGGEIGVGDRIEVIAVTDQDPTEMDSR
jgi:MOSC domain-containing protein YiiM